MECLQRVPDTYDAARELLDYGLLRTTASEMLSLAENTNDMMIEKGAKKRKGSASEGHHDDLDAEEREKIAEQLAKKIGLKG